MVENIAGVRAPFREPNTLLSILNPVSYTDRAPLAKVLLFLYKQSPAFARPIQIGFEP